MNRAPLPYRFTLTHPSAPPPLPKRWRRQSTLPPGAPVVLPPGVPLIFDARLALARLWQIYRRFVQYEGRPESYRWRSEPMPAVVKELARDCGIEIGPWPGRIVTRCPNCEAEVYLLRGAREGWVCRCCYPARWCQLEVSLGAYAMGLRIGLGGRQMVRRRRRLMKALARIATRARRPRDLVLLAAGAALIQYSPHWRRQPPHTRLPPCRSQGGPFLRAAAPHYLSAVVDTLLHPDAFYCRFAGS